MLFPSLSHFISLAVPRFHHMTSKNPPPQRPTLQIWSNIEANKMTRLGPILTLDHKRCKAPQRVDLGVWRVASGPGEPGKGRTGVEGASSFKMLLKPCPHQGPMHVGQTWTDLHLIQGWDGPILAFSWPLVHHHLLVCVCASV